MYHIRIFYNHTVRFVTKFNESETIFWGRWNSVRQSANWNFCVSQHHTPNILFGKFINLSNFSLHFHLLTSRIAFRRWHVTNLATKHRDVIDEHRSSTVEFQKISAAQKWNKILMPWKYLLFKEELIVSVSNCHFVCILLSKLCKTKLSWFLNYVNLTADDWQYCEKMLRKPSSSILRIRKCIEK